MRRKGFWEHTGLIVAIVVFVVGFLVLIGVLVLYGTNVLPWLSQKADAAGKAVCNKLPALIRWMFSC